MTDDGGRASLSAVDIARLLGRPEPTPEQQAVVEAPLEPALVVAGAGSGKTETMANRVVWLLANRHVAVSQVLGLTFTASGSRRASATSSASGCSPRRPIPSTCRP
jgi:DNA helicase-2/ATP-dependent DNA helicase PcrA